MAMNPVLFTKSVGMNELLAMNAPPVFTKLVFTKSVFTDSVEMNKHPQ